MGRIFILRLGAIWRGVRPIRLFYGPECAAAWQIKAGLRPRGEGGSGLAGGSGCGF